MNPDPPFDLVFIDADKASNLQYFKEGKRLVRKGGVIVRILGSFSSIRLLKPYFADRRQCGPLWESRGPIVFRQQRGGS